MLDTMLTGIQETSSQMDSVTAITAIKTGLNHMGLIGAGLAAGLAVIGAGLGLGRIGEGAAQGIARQPDASGDIKALALLLAFLLEGAALFAIVLGALFKFVD